MEYGFPFKIIAFESCTEFEFKEDPRRTCSYHPWMIYLIRQMRRVVSKRPLTSLFRACGLSFMVERDSASGALTPALAKSHGKLLLFDCWPYADRDLLKKHSETIREYVRPRRDARERATAITNSLRTTPGIPVVGIHIRRTDYREWLGGRYFYELNTYKTYMKRISELLSGNVAFIVCSDEPHVEADFADIPCRALHVSHESFMTDFALLMNCDYTIGPPSTFRMTASFLGNTPSFRIVSSDTPLPSMDVFRLPLIGEPT